MSQAQRVEAITVGIPATEAHQDQRLHLIEEQRDFLEAASRNSEVERPRWSTVLFSIRRIGFIKVCMTGTLCRSSWKSKL